MFLNLSNRDCQKQSSRPRDTPVQGKTDVSDGKADHPFKANPVSGGNPDSGWKKWQRLEEITGANDFRFRDKATI